MLVLAETAGALLCGRQAAGERGDGGQGLALALRHGGRRETRDERRDDEGRWQQQQQQQGRYGYGSEVWMGDAEGAGEREAGQWGACR